MGFALLWRSNRKKTYSKYSKTLDANTILRLVRLNAVR